jgi:hypothetical protein
VRCGNEAGLKSRWRKIVAGIEHRMEEAAEGVLVACHHLGVALRAGRAEIQPEHAADRLCGERHPLFLRCGNEPIGELSGVLSQ